MFSHGILRSIMLDFATDLYGTASTLARGTGISKELLELTPNFFKTSMSTHTGSLLGR
jgi:hypothetical protein